MLRFGNGMFRFQIGRMELENEMFSENQGKMGLRKERLGPERGIKGEKRRMTEACQARACAEMGLGFVSE
jgi:hypothetical protein